MVEKAILAVVLVLCVVFWLGPVCAAIYIDEQDRKKRGEPPRSPPGWPLFDERQKMAQQKAGNHALFALIGYLILWTLLDLVYGWAWTKDLVALTVGGMFFAALVWGVDCTLHDAMIGWNRQEKDMQATLFIYFMYSFNFLNFGSIIFKEGKVAGGIVSLMGSIGFLILGVTGLYAARRRKRRMVEEGDKGHEA